jgi:selenocysteine lyase/cysteine desulfurase
MPGLYEAGTLNIPGIVSLSSGVDFIKQTRTSFIRHQINNRIKLLCDSIVSNKKIRVYGNWNETDYTPILSFSINGISPEECGYILEQSFEIIVRTGLHCSPLIHRSLSTYPRGTVRISPSFFTTEEDILTTIKAIHQIAKM